MKTTFFDYFEFFYYLISILPGFPIIIIMFLNLIKTDSKLTSASTYVYFATSAMCFIQFVDFFLHDILGNKYLPIPIIFYIDLISMGFVMYFVTKIVILLFYEKVDKRINIFLIFASSIPLPIIIYSFFAENFYSQKYYQLVIWLMHIILLTNCLIFGLKYKSLRNDIQKKLFKYIWIILSFFLLIFIADRITKGFRLNPLPLFYFILSNIIIYFFYKKFILEKKNLLITPDSETINKYNITPREVEIIEKILLGKSNKEISSELFIAERTVKNHIYNIRS